jgi:hypothetical protein
MPGCLGRSKSIDAHHIKRECDFPDLARTVSNGICVCEECHEKINGNEEKYEKLFLEIIESKQDDEFAILMLKYGKGKRR